jgi:hypothetical protein
MTREAILFKRDSVEREGRCLDLGGVGGTRKPLAAIVSPSVSAVAHQLQRAQVSPRPYRRLIASFFHQSVQISSSGRNGSEMLIASLRQCEHGLSIAHW